MGMKEEDFKEEELWLKDLASQINACKAFGRFAPSSSEPEIKLVRTLMHLWWLKEISEVLKKTENLEMFKKMDKDVVTSVMIMLKDFYEEEFTEPLLSLKDLGIKGRNATRKDLVEIARTVIQEHVGSMAELLIGSVLTVSNNAYSPRWNSEQFEFRKMYKDLSAIMVRIEKHFGSHDERLIGAKKIEEMLLNAAGSVDLTRVKHRDINKTLKKLLDELRGLVPEK